MKLLASFLFCLSLVTHADVATQQKQFHSDPKETTHKTTLSIALLLANYDQGKSYRALFDEFEVTHPNIKITLSAYEDSKYKEHMTKWVNAQTGPDIVYWQGGERLFDLVKKNAIHDIDGLWTKEHWDITFPKRIKELVTYQGKTYALPYAFYQWGFYYKKSLFKRLNLTEPTTWDELLAVANTLTDHKMNAFAIGTKYHWPAAGWFDFINLRLNGLEFYRETLAGQISYHHPKIRQVLIKWKEIIEHGQFNEGHEHLTWHEAMPLVYREQAGMALIGNFIKDKIPAHLTDDIGFFPFPIMNSNIDQFELMPVEVFALTEWSKHTSEAQKVLKFLSNPLPQLSLATELGYIPASLKARSYLTGLSIEGAQLLDKSAGIMQFFDRDTDQSFSKKAIPVLSRFLSARDIEETMDSLEALRIELLKNTAKN